MKVVGLMSGTSLDGIDAALLDVRGAGGEAPAVELVAYRSAPYPPERRCAIRDAIESDGPSLESVSRLNVELGEWLAEAVVSLLEEAGVAPEDVAAIGSHGQTVWHDPPTPTRRGSTFQLGDAATIAECTGIAVVSDFRSRDVAAGGHGAPLVAWADRILFSSPDRVRALQNLGGMANVTRLPRQGEEVEAGHLAFDTGPGVALLDAAAELATGGDLRFDRDGELALAGRVDEALLGRLLDRPFFAETPPRSTGRESFGRPLVREIAHALEPGRPAQWCDLLATLTALTARSIGDAYRSWVLPRGVDEVFLTGGGAHNPALRSAIERELSPLPVRPGSELGFDPDAREAGAFALLAWAHLGGLSANVPAATGAAGPRILGSFTPSFPPGRAGGVADASARARGDRR